MRVILKRPRAADDLIELWDYPKTVSRERMRSSTMSTLNSISWSFVLPDTVSPAAYD